MLSNPADRANLHPVTGAWSSSKITWRNQPSIGASISHTSVGGAGWYDFYLTNLAKEWYSGKTANLWSGAAAGQESNDRKSWRSSDYATDPSLKPELTIVYEIDPHGVESFWTTAVSNVNTYNGNFFLQETDAGVEGRGIPATVTGPTTAWAIGKGSSVRNGPQPWNSA